MKKTVLLIIFSVYINSSIQAQNPSTITIEKTDNTSGSLNIKNPVGFWHLSGPRSYEANNNFSIFWHDGYYKRYLTILDNGNIGIGTANPSSKLQLMNGNNGISFDANSSWEGIGFNRSAKSGQILNTTKSAWQFTARDDYFALEGYNGANSNLLNVLKNGNIGIGTRSPDMKLTVKGNIHAEEVKIDLNVPAPDYVFRESYNLRSIEEVEKFIKKNSHLPEIPSAKEFEQNGVMQAEMDMNLLKKIEELTLYTISQEKQLDKQSKEIEELKILVQKLLESEK